MLNSREFKDILKESQEKLNEISLKLRELSKDKSNSEETAKKYQELSDTAEKTRQDILSLLSKKNNGSTKKDILGNNSKDTVVHQRRFGPWKA